MKRSFIIGSRGSDLALWQTNFVKSRLESFFHASTFEIKIITTTGDQLMDVALSKIGDKGLFTRQIEAELLSGEIDLAVHSLKDLQTTQPEGLAIGAVCKREMANDVFISKNGGSIDDLPEHATVATGSLRRKSQLLHYRPDLNIEEIRGNVPTRLRKFDGSGLDGIVLAYAGIERLGFGARVSQVISPEIMLPAAGQGAIGVEIREDDIDVGELVSKLDHLSTRICITAERGFLRRLEGGCQVPIGAYAVLESDRVHLNGMVGSTDGTVIFRDSIEGVSEEADVLGVQLAERLIECGASELLAGARSDAQAAANVVL